jgi:hypothetical protein
MLQFFTDRLALLSDLEKGWLNSDGEEDEDYPDRIPPSKKLCKKIIELLTPHIHLFVTNDDLPHITPLSPHPGISMTWEQGLFIFFYDEQHHPDDSHNPMSIYMSYIPTNLKMEDLESFINFIKN